MLIWFLLLLAVILATQRKSFLTAKDIWYFSRREPLVVEKLAWWGHRGCFVVWVLVITSYYLNDSSSQAMEVATIVPSVGLFSLLFGKTIWQMYWRARFFQYIELQRQAESHP